MKPTDHSTLGFWGATGVGVGAIVGGGILALAGVAFATTGPSAVVAFAANGLIALVTALSFAEMAAAFPESGGTYTFAKKVLSVETAFMVGWVVWFASIVAAVLYALGFAAYGATLLQELLRAAGGAVPEWTGGRALELTLALAATALYTAGLARRTSGGGQWATVGKVVLFAVLVAAGAWVAARRPLPELVGNLTPFFVAGAAGLVQAMGYTFIALQGFDLIAAVAGEVREPGRTIPRAMVVSLSVALLIYVPLLLIIATVGVPPGGSIQAESVASPETVVAVAAERFLGPVGLWLVIVAAVLAMLSALQANLLAASRVALAMARDRTLHPALARRHGQRGTPVPAILLTAATAGVTLLLVPDLATAGAMASLIFLVSFALAHGTNILARLRGGAAEAPFRLPWFPLLPAVGGLACAGLALFQALAVPAAGALAAVWLAAGGGLFFSLFARRAQVVDASAEALDPELVRLRGRSPLVLVPIARPASAVALVEVAHALAPRRVGRVLMLSVVRPPEAWQAGAEPRQLRDAQTILGQSLTTAFAADLRPEALVTISDRPWTEILRVASSHRCEGLVLGMGTVAEEVLGSELEALLGTVDAGVVVLRAPEGWRLSQVGRVLVPAGGRRDQSLLRARLLGSLRRAGVEEITFFGVLSPAVDAATRERFRRELSALAVDELATSLAVEVVEGDDVAQEIARRAQATDLLVLGLRRMSRRQKIFGPLALEVAARTDCALVMISRRG